MIEINKKIEKIDKSKFKEFLEKLIKDQKLNVEFKDMIESFSAIVYEVFDVDKNQYLEVPELGIAMFLLFGIFLILPCRRKKG